MAGDSVCFEPGSSGGSSGGPTYHLCGAIVGGAVTSTGLTNAAVEGSPFTADQAILVPEAGTYAVELAGRCYMLSGTTTITGRKYNSGSWSDIFSLELDSSGGRHTMTGSCSFALGDLLALNAEATIGFYNLAFDLKLTKE